MSLNYDIIAENSGANNNSIVFILKSSSVNPQARVFADGSSPGAWVNLNSIPQIPALGIRFQGLANALYDIQFKDDAHPAGILISKILFVSIGAGCYGFSTYNVIQKSDAGILFGVSIQNAGAFASYAIDVSIDNGHTYKHGINGTFYTGYYQPNGILAKYASWTLSEMSALGIDLASPGLKANGGFDGPCITNLATTLYVKDQSYAPLAATAVATNVTSNGADDGTITLSITGGSGNFHFTWTGPGGAVPNTTQNRTGLAPGVYSVIINDLVTGLTFEIDGIDITEPQLPPQPIIGQHFIVPMLNSLQFVIDTQLDACTTPQTPDNTLLCKQYYPGYTKSNYFSKVQICDTPKIQFESDFQSHIVQLMKYSNDQIVKYFSPIIVEQNIGNSNDYDIRITNNPDDATKSRVYFVLGNIPIPLAIGDFFQIVNDSNGFNGNYTIVDIQNDSAQGSQYLLISKAYAIADPYSLSTGRFVVSNSDFNVYEFDCDFSDVVKGYYYIKILASSDNFASATSEPISLRPVHKDTNLITYNNIDNAFGMTWTTGIIGMIRVESRLVKRVPKGDRTTSRNGDFSLVKVSARKERIFIFEILGVPPYLHEKLSVIFDVDNWAINGVAYQSSEDYADPDYKDLNLLSNSSIKVEQQNWFGKFNSDDIGVIGDEDEIEQGFINTQSGFINTQSGFLNR